MCRPRPTVVVTPSGVKPVEGTSRPLPAARTPAGPDGPNPLRLRPAALPQPPPSLRRDVRITYRLAPGDALLGLYSRHGERWFEHFGAMVRQQAIVPDPLNRHPFPEHGPPIASASSSPARAGALARGASRRAAGSGHAPAAPQRRPRATSGTSGATRCPDTAPRGRPLPAAGGLRRPAVRGLDGGAVHPGQPDRGRCRRWWPSSWATSAGSQELGGSPAFVDFLTGELAALGPRGGPRPPPTRRGRWSPARVRGASPGARRPAPPGRVRQRACPSRAASAGGRGRARSGGPIREFYRAAAAARALLARRGRSETFPLLGPRPGDDGPAQLAANRLLRDVLRAQGLPGALHRVPRRPRRHLLAGDPGRRAAGPAGAGRPASPTTSPDVRVAGRGGQRGRCPRYWATEQSHAEREARP